MMNNHGGKRSGAGRKPLSEKTVRVTISITASDLQKLQAINPNISAAVRELVARHSE